MEPIKVLDRHFIASLYLSTMPINIIIINFRRRGTQASLKRISNVGDTIYRFHVITFQLNVPIVNFTTTKKYAPIG